jgi:hypothetical protein
MSLTISGQPGASDDHRYITDKIALIGKIARGTRPQRHDRAFAGERRLMAGGVTGHLLGTIRHSSATMRPGRQCGEETRGRQTHRDAPG